MKHDFFSAHNPPRLFAHRGASGHRPENTLAAFELAIEMGARYLEMDVRMTRDGCVVVFHDRSVERTTDGSGAVDEMSLAELQALDAGYRFRSEGQDGHPFRGMGLRIPTLEEVIRTIPDAFFNIEVKQDDPPMEAALEQVLRRCGALDRVLLAARSERLLDRIRKRFGVRVATGTSQEEAVRLVQWLASGKKGDFRLEGEALQVPDRFMGREYITPLLIQATHELGLEFHVWTVNEPERMRYFLGMGVDGIMTDFPDRFPGN